MNELQEQLDYCFQVLPRVSRTFALGIELLREPLRRTVAAAYLICRILDTVEDTTAIPAAGRADLLERAGVELLDAELWPGCCRAIGELFPPEDFPGDEPELCRRAGDVLALYQSFPAAVRGAIAGPVGKMAAGMARTVRREEIPGGLRLATIEELEKYCYYVAGTVGLLLSNLFSLDRSAISVATAEILRSAGIDFGLGLQLTNIIKGVTDDISRGVSYLPREMLEKAGVTLPELLENPADPRGKRLVDDLVGLALARLDGGLAYTLAIPAGETDLRIFCALPLFFALRTLGRAGGGERVFGRKPLKIDREEVFNIHRRLEQAVGVDEILRREYLAEKRRNFPHGEPATAT